MKTNTLILFFALIAFSMKLSATDPVNANFEKVQNQNLKSANPSLPSDAHHNEFRIEKSECVSQIEMQELIRINEENKRALGIDSRVIRSSGGHPLFSLPIRPKAGFSDYGYYTVQYVIDHNLLYTNQLEDYNCGTRTYDWLGGNHAGTDLILWPYGWRSMDEEIMEITAAAPGVITTKIDGNFDRRCANNGGAVANTFIITHADGSSAWYMHFKLNSMNAKVVGDSVAEGEFLGLAGSSGSSNYPHVHFQVMDSNNDLIDPWTGPCNSINQDSWWQSQLPVMVPMINHISTHSSMMEYYNCPDPEITYEKDTFNIGDSLILKIYTRDLDFNAAMTINIKDPNGAIPITWNFTSPWSFTATTYTSWYYVLDNWWVDGKWTFEVVFAGNTYQHDFYIDRTVGIDEHDSNNSLYILPNPASGDFSLEFIADHSREAMVEIINVTGQLVKQKKVEVSQGRNNISFEKGSLAPGFYNVRLNINDVIRTERIIIQ